MCVLLYLFSVVTVTLVYQLLGFPVKSFFTAPLARELLICLSSCLPSLCLGSLQRELGYQDQQMGIPAFWVCFLRQHCGCYLHLGFYADAKFPISEFSLIPNFLFLTYFDVKPHKTFSIFLNATNQLYGMNKKTSGLINTEHFVPVRKVE